MTPWRRARQNAGSRSSTSGVDSTSTSSGAASSGAQGTSSSSTAARRSASTARLCSPPPFSSTSSSERRNGPKRVVRSRRLVLLAAQRDLPHVGAVLPQLLGEPRLPDAGLADELDERAEAHPDRRDRRARGPPARARGRRTAARPPLAIVRLRGLSREQLAQHDRVHRLALPLELERLELGRLERAPPPRANAADETQISSSPARAIRRAASAAVSPSTVYVLRKLAPTWPVKTRPSLTPMWTGSGRPASTIARTVRSIRSSSSPNVCGAPETRMIRPPSRSTSLSRNVTLCSSAAAWTVRTRSVERRRLPPRALRWRSPRRFPRSGRTRSPHGGARPRAGPPRAAARAVAPGPRPRAGCPRRAGGARPCPRTSGAARRSRPSPSPRRARRASRSAGGLRAEQDLARLGRGLHLHRSGRRGPGDEQLAVRLADEEELEAARCGGRRASAAGPRRPTSAGGRSRAASRRISNAARAARACVLVTVVEQQQRVAAELEQAAALGVRDVEQGREGRVHHLGDLLGARSTEARRGARTSP